MERASRRFTVEQVESGPGGGARRHAVLTARACEGVDTLHLWTGDADLAARLVPSAAFDLVPAPEAAPR